MAGRLNKGSPLDKKILTPVVAVKKAKKTVKKSKSKLKKILGM